MKFSRKIDCTACANCLQNLGARFTRKPISRGSPNILKVKLPAFEAEFLQVDEDGDKGF